jgi:NTP pyrophosphatase (non-canonical NTP hydrolase)
MYERERLIRRSTPLEKAANQKLFERQDRDDNWREMSDTDLICELEGEVHEIARLIYHYNSDMTGMGTEEFHYELLRECGDVLNYLRFIADKYGCLGALDG